MDVFNYTPSYSSQVSWQPTLLTTVFGEGYDQSAPDGIQNVKLQYDLTFTNITLIEYGQIVAFLRSKGGYLPFLWTAPAPLDVDGPLMFKCPKFAGTWEQANANTVIFRFTQTFNPE